MAISEAEIRFVTLQLLARSQSGFLTTSDLIDALEAHFSPVGKDAQLAPERNDTYFSQKVRNLVSHRNTSTSLEANGYAAYISAKEGWEITQVGRKFIASSARI